MDGLDLVERNRAAPIRPVPGCSPLVIEGILRFAADTAHERQRRLMYAARRIPKLDLRGPGMVGNQASEEIGRNAPHNPGCGAEPRRADGDVEARPPDHRHNGIAPVHGPHGQKVDQGISATEQHGLDLPSGPAIKCGPRIASRLSRSSWRISPWTRRFERWKSAI